MQAMAGAEDGWDFEPRKRRAASKPTIRDSSDSEEDFPKKRSRKRSLDDVSYEPTEEPLKRPRSLKAKGPAKPRAPKRTKVEDNVAHPVYSEEKIDEDEEGNRSKAKAQAKPRAPRVPRETKTKVSFRGKDASDQKPKREPDDEGLWTDNAEENAGYQELYRQELESLTRSERVSPDFEQGTAHHVQMEWKESDLLAQNECLDDWVAKNLVKLFEGDNTIPFIARYRKEMTGNMEPEQLRHAKDTYEEIKVIQHKAALMMKNIVKLEKMTPCIRKSILCARSVSELDLINTPFKAGSKRTLAERARQLGLEDAALTILDGSSHLSLSPLVDKNKEGLCDVKEVKQGIQHIIADIISKDRGVLDFIAELRKSANIRLESTRAKGTVVKGLAKGSTKDKANVKVKSLSAAEKQKLQAKTDEESKYRNYFEFSMNIKYVKPHQVLAINRGESQKELSVRVVVPDFVLDKLGSFCHRQWLSKGIQYELRTTLINDSIKDSYDRLIQPLIVRQVRSELNQNAERASIEVFAENLKKFLLMPPFRGHVVLGIDPGFRNGCKVALIGLSGEVLEIGIFNLNHGRRTWDLREDEDAHWLRRIMMKHRCETIALGNGTACRETEEYLSELLQIGFFKPLDVSYTIVSEQGASIYSCSDEAKKEFPDLDPNIISSVSIARRLQDPLGELVKVEPKNLGVGMYQHDMPEKKLSITLDEIVVECVSFVGVDVNTAPHCLLKRVAGFNSSKADKLLDYRSKHGPFISREEVKKVKGIGEKSYEQCAGFIRINPETIRSGSSSRKYNALDRTWIHPESYSFAKRFLDFCQVRVDDIGSTDSIKIIARAVTNAGGVASLAAKLNESESLVKLVSDGLQMPSNHDFRTEFEKPLFRKGLTDINQIQTGEILTGRITNKTHFGAFVDIGVGRNGLIHNTGMGGRHPQFGDKVQVKVLNVELARQRIGLQLLAIL